MQTSKTGRTDSSPADTAKTVSDGPNNSNAPAKPSAGWQPKGATTKRSQSAPPKAKEGRRVQITQKEVEADSAKVSGTQGAAAAARTPGQSSKKGELAAPTLPKPGDVFLGVPVEKSVLEAVEEQTRGQRDNPKWFSWRQNRITASIAHRVAHSRFVNGRSQTPPASYIASIIQSSPHVMTRAMNWGVQMEATAAQEYQRLKSERLGRPVSIQDCGLFIHPEKPWLAASPDGIVEVAGSGERLLLEIKCPFKHREHTVAQACQEDRDFCLERTDGKCRYQLKPRHSYFTQVQCQMAVVGLHKADFVVYTQRETAIVPVTFDPKFWAPVEKKLEMFYMKAVMPRLQQTAQVNPVFRREL